MFEVELVVDGYLDDVDGSGRACGRWIT
jgi:hypothetical protein